MIELMRPTIRVRFPLLMVLVCTVPWIAKGPTTYGFGVLLLLINSEPEVITPRLGRLYSLRFVRIFRVAANVMLVGLIILGMLGI